MDPVHQPYAPPAAPIEPAHTGRPAGDPLGWVLLATPVAAGICEALLGDLPGTVLSYGALAATCVLIGVDAHKHGQPAAKHVVGAVLLWLVFFPLYIHRRAAWGAPRRLPFAIIAVGVFIGGAFYRPLVVGPARAYVRCKPAGRTATARARSRCAGTSSSRAPTAPAAPATRAAASRRSRRAASRSPSRPSPAPRAATS
jgi:hypothetical protein